MTGPELAAALETLGWSRYELARRSGLSEPMIRKIEAGVRPVPPDVAAWLRRADAWFARNPVPIVRIPTPARSTAAD